MEKGGGRKLGFRQNGIEGVTRTGSNIEGMMKALSPARSSLPVYCTCLRNLSRRTESPLPRAEPSPAVPATAAPRLWRPGSAPPPPPTSPARARERERERETERERRNELTVHSPFWF